MDTLTGSGQAHPEPAPKTTGETATTTPPATGDTTAATPPPTPDGKDSTAAATDGADTTAPTVPETYEFTIPKSGAAFVDDADLTHFKTMARASGWTNVDAQAALEEHLSTVTAQADRWAVEAKADATYGGDKFHETARLARTAIDQVRPEGHARRDAFLRFLGRGGAGNHVEVLAFLADLGRRLGEDSPPRARTASQTPTGDAAKTLYDHPDSRALDGSP